MGIQGFFNNFKKQSDKNTQKFIVPATIEPDITRLYVDFISIIFDLIIDYPDQLNNRNDGIQEILLEHINSRLDIISNFYQNATVYVYFEAIPTVAKTIEQFARRLYRKILSDVKEDLKQRLLLNFQEFDFGLISFNSPFLNVIAERIEEHFKTIGRPIHVDKFNPITNNIGEAEHRIINHIATNLDTTDNKFVIYSPDADVFILSTLLTNNLTITGRNVIVNTLRRSEPIVNIQTGVVTREYFSIKSNIFVNYLIEKIKGTNKNRKRLVADVLFMFNILGDDFIPLFKNFSIQEVDLLYLGYSRLPVDVYILDYNETENKFTINKSNLLRFFQIPEISSIDIIQNRIRYYGASALEKPNSYFDTYFYNRIVYDYLIKCFEDGLYIDEIDHIKSKELTDNLRKRRPTHPEMKVQKVPPNTNNFGLTFLRRTVPPSYDIRYDDSQIYNQNSTYLLKITNTPFNTKKIELNGENYTDTNLLKLENLPSGAHPIDTNLMIINYLEGYQFILDMYFNLYGVVQNNFWYYKYSNTPKIVQLIEWLSINELPDYVVSTNPPYFTGEEYLSYLNNLVTLNHKIAIESINKHLDNLEDKRRVTRVEYDDLILLKGRGINIVFDCKNKKYLNKCSIEGETVESPLVFLQRTRTSSLPVLTIEPVQPVPKPKLRMEAVPFVPKRQQVPSPPMDKIIVGGVSLSDESKYKEKYLKYKSKYLELKKKFDFSF